METSNSDTTSQETLETPETKCVKRKSLLGLIVLGSSIFLAGCTLSLLAPFYTKARRIRRREKPFRLLYKRRSSYFHTCLSDTGQDNCGLDTTIFVGCY